MMRAPMAPLLLCLIGSDDERFVAPNSAGLAYHVGTPLTFWIVTVPAYHWYVLVWVGFTVTTGLWPTFRPPLWVTSKKTSCGLRPTSGEGATWLALNFSTSIGS